MCVGLCINVRMHACMYTETALQRAWVGMIVMMPEAALSVRQGRRPLMPTSAVCMDVCNKRKEGNSGRELGLCAFISDLYTHIHTQPKGFDSLSVDLGSHRLLSSSEAWRFVYVMCI